MYSNDKNSIKTQEQIEESNLRQLILDNPLDFESWLKLIKQIEQQNNYQRCVDTYKEFLKQYPLCYGYWRKWAELERKEKSSFQKIKDVYEKALEQLPQSIEIWHPYCSWFMEAEQDVQAVREFKTFIDAPGRKLNHYGATLPQQAIPEEIEKVRQTNPEFQEIDDEILSEILYSQRCEESKMQRIEDIRILYEKVVIETNKRRTYENSIKRTFFHAQALDEQQLQNWRHYLDFEESQGDSDRIILLFERCIIPACNYIEFWIRYANFIEQNQGVEAARNIYKRCIALNYRRPEMWTQLAYFEECQNNFQEAKSLYQKVYNEICPGLFDAIFKHLQLERRNGNDQEVENLYSYAKKIALQSKNSAVIAYVYQHQARYFQRCQKNLKKAIQIFEEALSQVQDRKVLYLSYIQLLHFEDEQDSLQKIKLAFESAINSQSLPGSEKQDLYIQYLDFLQEQWPDINFVKSVERKFAKMYYNIKPVGASFKAISRIGLKRERNDIKNAQFNDGPTKKSKKNA